MKPYPSIPGSRGQDFREFTAYVFDKLDGSNLRVEWSRKRGWYKFGTRERLFDETDEVFVEALPVFNATLAGDLERIARKERWNNLVVFMEFWGAKSFAGQHEPGDPKHVTVFDAAPERGELLGPKQFLEAFGDLGFPKVPGFLGRMNWTRGLVERVRLGQVEGVTFEGVVGKALERRELIMAKAKTQAWIDRVIERYGAERGAKIVNS